MDMKAQVQNDLCNMKEACRMPGGSAWIVYSALVLASDAAYVISQEPFFIAWFYMLNLINTATYVLHRPANTHAYDRGDAAFLKTYILLMVLSVIYKAYPAITG